MIQFIGLFGLVAQLVEQRTENPCVGGSIPPRATAKPTTTFCADLFDETKNLIKSNIPGTDHIIFRSTCTY